MDLQVLRKVPAGVPDYSTIARFRQDNENELEGLFVQVLKLCAEAGLVKVGVVVLDGTKVKGIMKTRTGYVQGYNGQVLVSELQVIVAADLTQEENDCRQLHQIGALAAGAGYWSEANCARSDPDGPELFVATTFG